MTAPSPPQRQAAYRELARLTEAQFAAIWAKLNLNDPSKLAEPLAQVLTEVADKYGSAAASLAADWYDENRADAKAAGSFTARPAQLPDASRFDALSGWGVGPLFGANPNGPLALSLIGGGLQRIVLDQGRQTTAQSVAADPARPTFARHASANACAFCAMLASRGAVYTSAESAGSVVGRGTAKNDRPGHRRGRPAGGIRSRGVRELGSDYHDDCHCVTIESFPGQTYQEAPYVAKWREAYTDSTRSQPTIDTSKTLAEMRKTLGTN